MNTKQFQLTGFESIGEKRFGGTFRNYKRKKNETRGRKKLKFTPKGNSRTARPIAIKKPMHLVLKSSHARGSKSFLHPDRALKIQLIIRKQERRFGVKVYEYANSGNHLHLVVRPRSRVAFQGFLRSISGLIARETLLNVKNETERSAKQNRILLSKEITGNSKPIKLTENILNLFV